jgi:cytoskeletal protein CcmA (bactofilin family)
MGFFQNWLGNGAKSASKPMPLEGMLPPTAAFGMPEQPARARPQLSLVPPLTAVRDFTTKPNIDPAALQKIMPRDGECALTVSGLDGVLTIGKDMVMTTDQAIHCQTLRVLGTLEATVYAQRIIIAEGGRVMGSVRTNEAEIRGEFDGSLHVRGVATIYNTASLFGKVRALELSIAKDALVHAADIKRVVPRVFEGVDQDQINGRRFDDGYSSMCMTVSQVSAIRR